MRILFTGPASAGHFYPMVPTAQALRAAGHEVLFASPQPVDLIRPAGFPVVEIGDGRSLRQIIEERIDGKLEYVSQDKTQEEVFDMAAEMFAYASRPDLDGLLATATDWGADLLVHDCFAAAAPLVAARLKIPAVVHNFGASAGRPMAERVATHVSDLYEEWGLTAPSIAASINVGPLGGDPDGLVMRYVPYNGGGIVPAEFLRRPERPRAVVTLGTVLSELDGVRAVVRMVQAAAEVDADFLLAVGSADLAPLGPLPDNVRGLPWVPLNELLGRADALIHHGGSGTMLTAVQAGLPQLLLPQGADHFVNAEALTATGAGLRSTSEAVDAPLLTRVLTDAALRDAARDLQAANTALPTPAAVVTALEDLAARH